MYNRSVTCSINKDGRIRHEHRGSSLSIGVASTPIGSKLIDTIKYDEYVTDELQKLLNHALLHKCLPDELFEFKIHYNAVADKAESLNELM